MTLTLLIYFTFIVFTLSTLFLGNRMAVLTLLSAVYEISCCSPFLFKQSYRTLDYFQFSGCEIVSHVGYDLHFPDY